MKEVCRVTTTGTFFSYNAIIDILKSSLASNKHYKHKEFSIWSMTFHMKYD